MKKLSALFVFLALFFFSLQVHAQVSCSRVTGPFGEGDPLTAADYDGELNNIVDCFIGAFPVSGGTISGNVIIDGDAKIYDGADLILYSDSGTTPKFSVDGATGLTQIITSAGGGAATDTDTRLKLEKGGNVYVEFETGAANTAGLLFSDASSGVGQFTYSHSSDQFNLNQHTAIAATKRLYFDGGGDTYMAETSGNNLAIVAGNNQTVLMTTTSFQLGNSTDLFMVTGKKINFDATTGNNYIYQQSANDNRIVAGGSDNVRFTSSITEFYKDIFFNTIDTTASGANAYINPADGQIMRSTSASKYKTNVLDYTDSAKVYDLRPVTYQDKNEVDNNPETLKRYLGFIGEEVNEVEPMLVQYGAEGQVEGLSYDRITVMLVAELKKLKTQNDFLTLEVQELKARINAQ